MAFGTRWLIPVTALVFLCPTVVIADTLKITSNPSGATVEINSVAVGATPYEEQVAGGYFHKPRTALGQRLQHAMVARISLAGYAAKEIQMTEGPMEWVSLRGHHHGEYWVLKAKRFHVELDAIREVFTGSIATDAAMATASEANPEGELPLEDVIARAKRGVVYLKSLSKAGSGFFITETGLIATNA